MSWLAPAILGIMIILLGFYRAVRKPGTDSENEDEDIMAACMVPWMGS